MVYDLVYGFAKRTMAAGSRIFSFPPPPPLLFFKTDFKGEVDWFLNPSTSPLKSVFDSSQLSGSINVQDGGTTSKQFMDRAPKYACFAGYYKCSK